MNTVKDVIDRVTKASEDKYDVKVNIGRVRYVNGKIKFANLSNTIFAGENNVERVFKTPLVPSDNGWQQLCGYLGIPESQWIHTNPDAIISLLVSHWSEHRSNTAKDTLALFRCKGDQLRAVLSSQYVPLDNQKIVNALHLAISNIKTEVRSYFDTDTSFNLKITFPDLTKDHTRSNGIVETYKTGILIRNSETGHSSLIVSPFIYRKACTNDLVVEQMSALNHQHRWVTDSWLNAHMEKAIADSLQSSDQIIKAFEHSDTVVVKEPEKVLENLLRTGKYSQKVVEKAQSCLAAEPGSTKYSILNAITAAGRVVRSEGNLTQADSLEAFAGNALFKTNW